MPRAAEPRPVLSRVDASGAVHGMLDGAGWPTALSRSWDGVRLLQVRSDPIDVPQGELVNHAIVLNLGSDATYESRFERAWEQHRLPHQGVAVFPAGVPYAARGRDARDYLFVEVEPAFLASALGAPEEARRLPYVAGAPDPFARHVLLALAEEARNGRPGLGALRAQSLTAALVAHLAEGELRAAPAPAGTLPSPKLRRVLEYVAAHLDAPLTLQRLAELAQMDVFRFIRAFKQSTGLSPHRYVLEARITRAKALLANRELSITDVALQTGFATPSHFSVTFRRIASVTPREYRDGLR